MEVESRFRGGLGQEGRSEQGCESGGGKFASIGSVHGGSPDPLTPTGGRLFQGVYRNRRGDARKLGVGATNAVDGTRLLSVLCVSSAISAVIKT